MGSLLATIWAGRSLFLHARPWSSASTSSSRCGTSTAYLRIRRAVSDSHGTSPEPRATLMLMLTSPGPRATLMLTSPGPHANLMLTSPGPRVTVICQGST